MDQKKEKKYTAVNVPMDTYRLLEALRVAVTTATGKVPSMAALVTLALEAEAQKYDIAR